MNKPAVVGIIVLVIIAVLATAFIINSQNPNSVANATFDMQIPESGGKEFKVSIINKLDSEYLFSPWTLKVTNCNESSAEFGKGIYSAEGEVNLPPNKTQEIAKAHLWGSTDDSCIFEVELTLENYGTVSKVYTLNMELYTERLAITDVAFEDFEWPIDDTMSVTVKNLGIIPITFKELYVDEGSHDYLISSVTLQPNEESTVEFNIGWVSGHIYQIIVVTTEGTRATYTAAAPS